MCPHLPRTTDLPQMLKKTSQKCHQLLFPFFAFQICNSISLITVVFLHGGIRKNTFKEVMFALSLALWVSEVHSATCPPDTSSSQRADVVAKVSVVFGRLLFFQLCSTPTAFGFSVLCLLLCLFQRSAFSSYPSKDK